MSTTRLDRTRAIVTAEVEICDMLLEVGRVVVAVEVMVVFNGIGAFAFCFKRGNPIDIVQYCPRRMKTKASTYCALVGWRCAMMILPFAPSKIPSKVAFGLI